MRAFAFVLAAVIPLVIVGLGDLSQRFGLRNGVFCVLARLTGEPVRMAPRCFRELRAVGAAQAANVVLIAHRVAVLITGSVALGTARNPVPGAVDSLGVEPDFWRIKPDLWQPVDMPTAMVASVPDVGFP